MREGRNENRAMLDGSPATNSAQLLRYANVPCGKCGAVRIDSQIGLEPTLAAYIATLVDVFREVRRVLRNDGTCWLNLGDSYANDTKWGGSSGGKHVTALHGNSGIGRQKVTTNLKSKDLMMVPARVAIALQDDGWYLRSDIIWAKRNCMPESVQGSQYVRHRVTISDYERLSGLRYEGQRNGEAWAGDVPDVQARKLPDGEEALPAEREGQGNGEAAGRAARRDGETPEVLSVGARPEEQRQVSANGEGPGSRSEAVSELQGSAAERRRDSDSRGLAEDSRESQLSLLLLQETPDAIDARPRHTTSQGRAELAREHRAGLPELQLLEEGQTDSTLLVDCPGCEKCSATDGYILRWNAGRPTSSHEHIFLLTKSPRYFYDAEAVREPHLSDAVAVHWKDKVYDQSFLAAKQANGTKGRPSGVAGMPEAGRNQRNVWHLATEPFPEAHFATFPTEIPRRCIKAGTSEKGACSACGAPWVRVVERAFIPQADVCAEKRAKASNKGMDASNGWGDVPRGSMDTQTTGWAASCSCDAGVVPCVVLDPFLGSGTTLLVADQLGRDGIGIELNAEYAAMSKARIYGDAPLFAQVAAD
jgi:DNA modification methylase